MNNNKNSLFWCLAFVLFALASCNSEDTDYLQWQKDNEAAYDAIKANTNWKELDTNDGPSGIYYRDLTEPEAELGNEHPIETASVVVNYTGKSYDDVVFDSRKKITLTVNLLVRGFGATLQQMYTGQKWEVCIPYYLGYGVSGDDTGIIKGYTTLFFEIELLQINQHPK